MDDRANRGASARKSALTCGNGAGNAGEHGFDEGRMGLENRVLPASLRTTGELADTSEEGPDMPNDSQTTARRAERGR